jgi:hypothetical protein
MPQAGLTRALQGNKPTQFDILSLVNDAHPSTAELLDDAVVRDGLADHGAQGCNVRRAAKGESTKERVRQNEKSRVLSLLRTLPRSSGNMSLSLSGAGAGRRVCTVVASLHRRGSN